MPVPLQHCCVLSGVFSRAFFFLCPFCFFFLSRVRSFPSRGWLGSFAWLLFVVVAFFVSFVLWLGCVVWFFFPFSCCCLCFCCLVVGRFRGVCASWLVFCLWFRLVCLCACCALSRFCWGFAPFFLINWRSLNRIINEITFRTIKVNGKIISVEFMSALRTNTSKKRMVI